MKKRLSFILLVMAVPMTMWAASVYINGIYYAFYDNEAIVTSGTNKYTGNIVIPSTVTYNNVVYNVKRIGEAAFYDCKALKSVIIQEGLTTIGQEAFSGCTVLTSISLPNSIKFIDRWVFQNCKALTTINIPNGLTVIDPTAFENCTSLPVIDNIRYADTYLLGAVDKTLTNYHIKEGTHIIGGYAFEGCSALTTIDIPNSVEIIQDWVFESCTNLRSIIIPYSVTKMGCAFSQCISLSSITIYQ